MLINLLLASLLIGLVVSSLIMVDRATSIVASFARALLKFTRRSKLLTEYILRAYLRYKKVTSRNLIHNSY